MRQGRSPSIYWLYFYSVAIWPKTTNLLPNHISHSQVQCDPTGVVGTTTTIPLISSEVKHTSYNANSSKICFNCTEATFEKDNDPNTSVITFDIRLTINHHTKGKPDHISHVIITISPLGQHSEEVSTINFATTEGYSSSTVCVTNIHKTCDVLSTFPLVPDQRRYIRSVSYAISFDSSTDKMYYVVHVNGKAKAVYYSAFDFSLNRYKMVLQTFGTSADVTYTASAKSLSNPGYANLTSYSSISHGNCNTAKPYCNIMPSCLEVADLCHYEIETKNDDKVVFVKTTETPRTFEYNVVYQSGLDLIKLDVEGTAGEISLIRYNYELLDVIKISSSFAKDGPLQLNIHLNPDEQFQSKNAVTINLSNLCTPFSVVVMFKATSKCNAELESPKIFILIEEKMILLGYMSSRYKTLNAVKLSGQLKILDVNTISNENCGTTFSLSVSSIIVSVIIVFIISSIIALFFKRIRKERENMAFLVNPTISHHADKEYSKSAARIALTKEENNSGKINEEIELESIHGNLYYEESS